MNEEILYVPDPCELTYTNTLILSNAALSLGCAFICRESNQNLSIISFILAWTFILLQLKEFRNMAFYINDSIFGSIFFFLIQFLFLFHTVNTIAATIIRLSFYSYLFIKILFLFPTITFIIYIISAVNSLNKKYFIKC